jgi:lysophospholipase L1-like esterase
MQALYDAARAAAPATVILVGGPDWASDLSGVATSYALTGTNIVYNVHVYTQTHSTRADWDSHFGVVTPLYPVSATEFGTLDCSSGTTASLLRYFQAPLGDASKRMSWTIWGWSDPGSCAQPSIINDWDATPLADDSNADGDHAYQRSLGNSQGQLVHDTLAAYDECGDVPATTDVLSLGDSITYGVNLPLNESYPGDVSASSGSSYFVMNAGMPGDTVAASAGYPGMTARYQTFDTPGGYEYCIFLGGVNDIGRGATAAQTFANATALFAQMKAAGCQLVLFELTPFKGAPYGYDNPTSQSEAVLYNQDLAGYCGDGGATCIDTRAALGDGTTPPAYLPQYDSGDHLHPSAAGYAVMAQLVQPVVH